MIKPYNTDFKTLLNEVGQSESILLDPDNIPQTNAPPSFPVEALPAVISDYIYSLTDAGFCPNFLAAAGLFAASVAIANAHKIQLKPTFRPLNVALFIPLIGESASGKSQALDKMLCPLHDRHNQAWREYNLEVAQQNPEIKEPPSLIISNATFGALTSDLAANAGGVGLETDELISFTGSANQFDKGKGSDIANILTLLDGKTFHCSRKKEKIFIERPFLSIIGGLQPIRLSQFYNAENLESGFFYRALNVYGGVERGYFNDGTNAPDTLDAETNYNATINGLCDGRERTETVWTYSPAALGVFKDYYNGVSDRQKAGQIEKLELTIRTKADLLFHKYALIYELLTRVHNGGGTNGDFTFDPIVSEAAALAALELVEYAVKTALYTREKLAANATNTITRPAAVAVTKENELKLHAALPAEFTTGQAVTIGTKTLKICKRTVNDYLKNTSLYTSNGHGKYIKI